ncbi:hypothetical protein GTW71_11295 [Streptomyces sp. SID6041]|nr:hypothetical protein [Streptomyces sp. SID6041]
MTAATSAKGVDGEDGVDGVDGLIGPGPVAYPRAVMVRAFVDDIKVVP